MQPTAEDFAFSRLIAYAAYQWPSYQVAAHHKLIARHLEKVERGEIKRLMITMPPRHGKSMLASEFFPSWYLGRNPDRFVVAATYGQDLADDFGRKVRNLIQGDAFQAVFPSVELSADSKAAKRFTVEDTSHGLISNLKQSGAYYGVGVGGALTGRGAHLLLIDDPVKNREDAESETIRAKIKDWYRSTAYTRLMPNGAVVIIQTRWHEDDLSGWLLEEHADEGWVVLNLPAIDEDNKALWPEQYPIKELEKIKRAIGARDWEALYQQRPAPEDGDYFKKEWFKPYKQEQRPDLNTLRIYGGSDYAVTSKGGDYTVHIVAGIDPQSRIWLLDLWRGQEDSSVWVESFCDLVNQYKPIAWAEETGQIRSAIGSYLKRRMREKRAYVAQEVFPTRGDKAIRAQSIRGRAALNGLYVPIDAPWYSLFENELLSFPNGRHDDQVDALGLIGQLLDQMYEKAEEKAEEPKHEKDWFSDFDNDESGEGWKVI